MSKKRYDKRVEMTYYLNEEEAEHLRRMSREAEVPMTQIVRRALMHAGYLQWKKR